MLTNSTRSTGETKQTEDDIEGPISADVQKPSTSKQRRSFKREKKEQLALARARKKLKQDEHIFYHMLEEKDELLRIERKLSEGLRSLLDERDQRITDLKRQLSNKDRQILRLKARSKTATPRKLVVKLKSRSHARNRIRSNSPSGSNDDLLQDGIDSDLEDDSTNIQDGFGLE